jgi:hypothetical protein
MKTPERRRDWLVGSILAGIGLLMLTGVIKPGFGSLTSSPFFPWFLIAVGIGVPILMRRRPGV